MNVLLPDGFKPISQPPSLLPAKVGSWPTSQRSNTLLLILNGRYAIGWYLIEEDGSEIWNAQYRHGDQSKRIDGWKELPSL